MRRRFARRQWARRWGMWRPLLLAFVALVALGAVVWAVWFSSLLGVDEVTVDGVEYLDERQVLEAAGIADAHPLVRVDPSAVRRRVEALAPVADAEVSRRFPGTVRIHVTERRAVAVSLVGGRWSGIDAEGVVFRQYPKFPRGLPRVKVVGDVDREVLQEAAAVVNSLPVRVASTVSRVDVETIDHITLVLKGGRQVLWGSSDDSAQKAKVLVALVAASEDRYFDVSVPGQPVTSPRPPR